MSHEKNLFEASHYVPGTNGLLSPFDPGTDSLPDDLRRALDAIKDSN